MTDRRQAASDGKDAITNEEATALGVLSQQIEDFHGHSLTEIDAPTEPNRALIAVMPRGKTIQDLTPILDKQLPHPKRRIGTATLFDVASFIKHTNRFSRTEDAIVFADPDGPSDEGPQFTAIFDYHQATETANTVGNDSPASIPGAPGWLQHRAIYEPALSDAWEAWVENSGEFMSQADFAHFIEERVLELQVPNVDDPTLNRFTAALGSAVATPADIVALSRELQINVAIAVRNAVVTSSGAISVVYDEQHKDGEGKPLTIPQLFQICIPVFYNGANYIMTVKLRYRFANTKVQWGYVLANKELVFDDAFKGIIKKVEEETALSVLVGSAEK